MVEAFPSPSHPGTEDVEQPGLGGQHSLGDGRGWEYPDSVLLLDFHFDE